MSKQTFIYAAGGTAGHVYPAQSIAEQAPEALHILITDTRGSKFSDRGIFTKILITPLNRKKLFRTFWQTVAVTHQCFKNTTINGVFVLGGYASIVPALIAWFKKIPIYVVETNSLMGKANRLISKLKSQVFTTFNLNKTYTQLGFFVRKEIQPSTHNNDPKQFNILILGSSVGATFFANKLPAILELLPANIIQKLNLTQHAPNLQQAELSKKYNQLGIKHTLSDFITNIQAEMQKADLIICRAGASTISEACTIGKFMLLVPYKLAADDHQTKNAQIIENIGYAHTISEDNFDPKQVAKYLEDFINQRKTPPQLAIPADAAKTIWNYVS